MWYNLNIVYSLLCGEETVRYCPPLVLSVPFADEFRVSSQENESSKKQGLSGNYVLKVSDCNVALYSATSLIPTQFTLKLTGIKRLQQCSLVDKHGNKEEILVIYTML